MALSTVFRIGFDGSKGIIHVLQSAKRNMQSTMDHHPVITEYLQDECTKGQTAGPFRSNEIPGVHISRFGVIPEK